MNRSSAVRISGAVALLLVSGTSLLAAPPDVTWEDANARRMFVLCHDGDAHKTIVVDTTRPEDLRVAIRLQELIFRLGGARLPLVDRGAVGSNRWDKIHIAWDYFPMTARGHPFVIEMEQMDPGAFNPSKLIMIAGAGAEGAGLEQAVSAFTTEAFGVPLEALDRQYDWPPTRKVLAIPEDFGPVNGEQAKQPIPAAVVDKLRTLFSQHYPEATFENRELNGVHVEHRLATFNSPSQNAKAKHENPAQRGPKQGGIACHAYWQQGPYRGQRALPPGGVETIDRKAYKQLLAAPYSPGQDAHLWVSLSYPPDASQEFLKEFLAILKEFEKTGE